MRADRRTNRHVRANRHPRGSGCVRSRDRQGAGQVVAAMSVEEQDAPGSHCDE